MSPHAAEPSNPIPTGRARADRRRVGRVALALLGAVGLVLKRHYSGPFQATVWSYGGNVAVSFAVYFMLAASPFGARLGGPVTAGAALLAVEAFELTDGFGLMRNVCERLDLVANGVGVALAWVTDAALRGGTAGNRPRHDSPAS